MPVADFIKKCLVITGCVLVVLYFYFPRYEFIDATHRVNKISGQSENFSHQPYNYGWNK